MTVSNLPNGNFKEILDKMSADPLAVNQALKNAMSVNQKLAEVAISAAEQSAEVSSKWTREMLNKVSEVTVAKDEPADYARTVSELTTAALEMSAQNMSAFADIAKQVQVDTLEVLLATNQAGDEGAENKGKKASEVKPAAKSAKTSVGTKAA